MKFPRAFNLDYHGEAILRWMEERDLEPSIVLRATSTVVEEEEVTDSDDVDEEEEQVLKDVVQHDWIQESTETERGVGEEEAPAGLAHSIATTQEDQASVETVTETFLIETQSVSLEVGNKYCIESVELDQIMEGGESQNQSELQCISHKKNQPRTTMSQAWLQALLKSIDRTTNRPRLASATWDESMRQHSRKPSQPKIPWLQPLQLYQNVSISVASAVKKRTASVFHRLTRAQYEPSRKKQKTSIIDAFLYRGSFSENLQTAQSRNEGAIVVYQQQQEQPLFWSMNPQRLLECAAHVAQAMLFQMQQKQQAPSVEDQQKSLSNESERSMCFNGAAELLRLPKNHPTSPDTIELPIEHDQMNFHPLDDGKDDLEFCMTLTDTLFPHLFDTDLQRASHETKESREDRAAEEQVHAKGVSFSADVEIAGAPMFHHSSKDHRKSKKDKKMWSKERKEKRKREKALGTSVSRKREKTTDTDNHHQNTVNACKTQGGIDKRSSGSEVLKETTSSKSTAAAQDIATRPDQLQQRILKANRSTKHAQSLSVKKPFRPKMIMADTHSQPRHVQQETHRPSALRNAMGKPASQGFNVYGTTATKRPLANPEALNHATQNRKSNTTQRAFENQTTIPFIAYDNGASSDAQNACLQQESEQIQQTVTSQRPGEIWPPVGLTPALNCHQRTSQHPPIRILCSENFLDTWSDLVADLGSGQWKALAVEEGEAGAPVGLCATGRQIELIDSSLLAVCGVDIELPCRESIIVHSLSALEHEVAAKEVVLDLARLVAGGRYRCVHVIICYDVKLSAQTTRHLASLYAVGLRNSDSGVSTSTHFKTASQLSISACIASTVFEASRKSNSQYQDAVHELVPDIIHDAEIQHTIKFLLSMIPMLTATGALQWVQLMHKLDPGVKLFPYMLESDSLRNEVLKMATCQIDNRFPSVALEEINPATLEYLHQLMTLHLNISVTPP